MESGIQMRLVPIGFGEAVDRIETLLKERGIKLFCVIDHSAEAKAVGLRMPRTKLLIFGNAKAGTPLMLATPSVAIDLPLKLLVTEHTDGSVAVPGMIRVGCSGGMNLKRSLPPISERQKA